MSLRLSLVALVAFGCGGQTAPALDCWSDGTIETPEGPRLVVACTRTVEAPASCQRVEATRWQCNILHTSQSDCEAFPGLC